MQNRVLSLCHLFSWRSWGLGSISQRTTLRPQGIKGPRSQSRKVVVGTQPCCPHPTELVSALQMGLFSSGVLLLSAP